MEYPGRQQDCTTEAELGGDHLSDDRQDRRNRYAEADTRKNVRRSSRDRDLVGKLESPEGNDADDYVVGKPKQGDGERYHR